MLLKVNTHNAHFDMTFMLAATRLQCKIDGVQTICMLSHLLSAYYLATRSHSSKLAVQTWVKAVQGRASLSGVEARYDASPEVQPCVGSYGENALVCAVAAACRT
jgi:hypothetical protein